MNEEIKEIFKTNKAYKLDDICKKIKTMSKEDIQKELNELEFNGFLIKENNKYRLFPKDYKLPKKQSDARLYKQAGNSVCVPVINRIAESILEAIK